ncbi:hypothetical protein P3X46_013225 [Hevea brasiliensis]|uniref:BHLH domain-containing protein n=1 Tax=Hevea brasiliensis TaxID=3981 RepID=A0ABQ9M577_HEVBR|nr:hypothetical protein P3X46_013225 [Hevea brasiliensis]
MNEEAGCFDPNSTVEGPDDGLSQVLQPPPVMAGSTANSHNSFKENLKLSTEELSYHHSDPLQKEDVSAAMEIQLQNQQMVFNTHTTPLGFGGDLSMTDKLCESYKQLSATELQRRQQLIDKYRTLRDLIPHPIKPDRASVVGDAIEYIKELLQTVNVLKIRLEKKRCARERSKGHKTEEDSAGNNGHESSSIKNPLGDPDQSFNDGSLSSSWLQRKSEDTEVDVRIVGDEINCLLLVSKVLDELQLDLYQVTGSHNGDYYSFLFNTKVCLINYTPHFLILENLVNIITLDMNGSSVYASSIANKLIEVPFDPIPFSNYRELTMEPININKNFQSPGKLESQRKLHGSGIIGNGKRGSNRTVKRLLSSDLEMAVVAIALALSNTRIADGIIMSAFLLIFLEYMGKRLFCLLKPCLLAFRPFIRGVFS